MYFSKTGFHAEKEQDDALWLCPPIFESAAKEIPFTVSEGGYEASGFTATDSVEVVSAGLYRVTREIRNVGKGTRTGKFIVECRDLFAATKTLIPCVSFDGNEKSGGKEAHGFYENGELWIHAYDRESIPSMTLTEDKTVLAALFASTKDLASLETACAMYPSADGSFCHRIYYPVTEAPYTYSDHDVMTERYDTYVTVKPGECFTVEFYILVDTPKWENYGMATVLDRMPEIFPFAHTACLSPEEVWDASFAHCDFFLEEINGIKMFSNALRNKEGTDEICKRWTTYEAGWSGQCVKQARLYILRAQKTGKREYLDTALSCLDAWAASQRESGLFQINYYRNISKQYLPGDICNYGWAASEMADAYLLLREMGIDKPEYLTFAKRVCDFFVTHYDEKTGFGLRWDMDGTKVAEGGSAGGFMIMGMLKVYKASGDEKYLDAAKRAMELYTARDIDNFVCTAGALDCACVDKETAYPFILTALDLYDITGEEKYLVTAQKAAYYFESWTYYYDAPYEADSDFVKYGYYTSGGTAVSTQHPAIDLWGAIAIPEYVRLARATGDDRWLRRAYALWCNCILCITPKEGRVLYGKRPYGLQSEAFFQARWTRKYKPNCEMRGHLNDMYVGWPAAFRLTTLHRMEAELQEGWSLLR